MVKLRTQPAALLAQHGLGGLSMPMANPFICIASFTGVVAKLPVCELQAQTCLQHILPPMGSAFIRADIRAGIAWTTSTSRRGCHGDLCMLHAFVNIHGVGFRLYDHSHYS